MNRHKQQMIKAAVSALKRHPRLMAAARQPGQFYNRAKCVSNGYPRSMFLPSHRVRYLTVIPFKNWNVGELVSLHRNLGQEFRIELSPL